MSVIRVRRAKKITLTPDGIGDITLSNNTIDPNATQNDSVGTLGVFDASATPFNWAINNTKFELSAATGDTVTLVRSATGTLTAGGTETVIVTNTDSEARVVQKQFTINVDTLVTDVFTDMSTVDVADPSGFVIGHLFAVNGKTPVTFANSPTNTKFAVSSTGTITRSSSGTLSAGSETLSIDATDANGNVFQEDITITVTNTGAQEPTDLATPDPPAWGRAITLDGSFPATITVSTFGSGTLAVGQQFQTETALKSACTALGNQIIINVPSGFEGDWGAVTDLAIVAPWTLSGGPTATTKTFQTSLAGQSPGQVAYIKGFKVGPLDSLLEQPRAYALTSVGTYAMQAGDTITQGTTTAKVLSYTNDSGVVASGTGVGRLVVSEQVGNFSASTFNIGANTDVGTFVSGSFRYGPQRQEGSTGVKHSGRGRMIVVGCHVRNISTNGIASDGDQDIYTVSSELWVYDSRVTWCGSAGTDTQHNIYVHYTNFRFIRSVSQDCGSGHTMKAETRRCVILDSAIVRDSGEVDAIGTKTITSGTSSTTIPLNGWAVSGGSVSIPNTLVRIISDGDSRGYLFEVTGTDPSDNVITEKVRGSVNGRSYTNRRYKTVTAAINVTAISGQSQLGATVYAGYGIGLSHEMPELNLSHIQDKRVARMLIAKNGIAQGGATMIDTSRRTSKFGGHTPDKSPQCFDGDSELNTGGNLVPWASNLMDGSDSKYMIAGLLNGDHSQSTTDFRSSAWQWFEADNGLIENPIVPNVDYDVRAQRNDATILSFTAKITNGTFTVADLNANTISITGLTGFGGTMPVPTTSSNAIGVRLTTTGTLPAPLAVDTNYYYSISGGLSTSASNAFAGTHVNITDNGSGTHKLHCYTRNSSTGGYDVRFPIGTTYGGSNGGNSNRIVAMKKSADPWDTALLNAKIFNAAHANYLYAPNGDCLTNGVLDFTKQANFETGYYQDILYCVDTDTTSTLFGPEAKWYHGFHILGGTSIELPHPPVNRPQGQHSIAFTSGGTYQILIGDTITGATSGATGTVGGVKVTSGTLAAGTAAGTIYLTAKTGTFQAENLNVGANSNVATVSGAATTDWPDVANAGTFAEPLVGSGPVAWGRNPVGYVNRDNEGANSDYVQLYADLHMDIGYFIEDSRFGGSTLNHFGGYLDPGGSITNMYDYPDSRWLNSSGTFVQVSSSNKSPMPTSSYTRLTAAASSSATKLYVASTTGITSGKKILMELPLLPGANDAIYIGAVNGAPSSDGGGPYINVTPAIPRAAANRARFACFTAAGTPPAHRIDPADYLTS
jgi:hypothetical protein